MLAALERDPFTAPLDKRQHTLVTYALKLTQFPHSVAEEDIDTLRRAGLSDAAIHDAAAVAAYFNFVNRMASGLGVGLETE
ncbi:MAG: peroxidase [Acidobacteria bacterium]|nr:peroxidase [Acidobacteriota bacterium]